MSSSSIDFDPRALTQGPRHPGHARRQGPAQLGRASMRRGIWTLTLGAGGPEEQYHCQGRTWGFPRSSAQAPLPPLHAVGTGGSSASPPGSRRSMGRRPRLLHDKGGIRGVRRCGEVREHGEGDGHEGVRVQRGMFIASIRGPPRGADRGRDRWAARRGSCNKANEKKAI